MQHQHVGEERSRGRGAGDRQPPHRGRGPQVRGRPRGGQDQEDAETKICSVHLKKQPAGHSIQAQGTQYTVQIGKLCRIYAYDTALLHC